MSLAIKRSQPLQWPRFGRSWAWLAGTLIIALSALGVWAYARTRPVTASVARRDVVAFLPLKGTVIAPPGERADVSAPYQAPVARVLTTVGANVDRGEVLVELSHPSVKAAYEQARQALRAAETAYANATRLHGAEVGAAEKRLASARATEKAARVAAARAETPLDEAAADTVRETTPSLEAAVQARFDAELELTQAQARLDSALLPYRQQLEAARVAFEEAQAGRKLAMVRAPISGTVLALNAQPGEEVGTDQKTPVATLVDLDALQALVEMKPAQAAQVKPGMPVVLAVAGLRGQQFDGRVKAITTEPPQARRGADYVAVVEIANERGLVKPEMAAHVSVEIGEAKDVLAVPNDAVRRDRTGRPVVRVLRNGEWREVVVETGLTDGQYVEVKSGLRPGETVQVRPKLV